MPNWCEGVLKVRGTKENLLNFLKNGIQRHAYMFDDKTGLKIQILDLELQHEDGGSYFVKEKKLVDGKSTWLCINDTSRLFVTKDIDWYFCYEQGEYIKYLDVQQAWNIEESQFLKLSKKYNLDFKIKAYECGQQFSREVEIVDGHITQNVTNYYDDYFWDAYDPRLGG